jgi:hypothetical protein
MGKIKGDGYRYGMVLHVPIPCGCHPYLRMDLTIRDELKFSLDFIIKLHKGMKVDDSSFLSGSFWCPVYLARATNRKFMFSLT